MNRELAWQNFLPRGACSLNTKSQLVKNLFNGLQEMHGISRRIDLFHQEMAHAHPDRPR